MTSLRVIHESWGEGRILPSTELFDDEGNVYVDIMFDHGIEHEVLVDEGLADVIRGGAKLAGRAVAAPGRAVRAVKGAVDRATTATKSAVNRATTATKQFGQSVGSAYQSGKTAHMKSSAPAPASTRDVVGGKQASVSYGGLVGKSAGSLVPSAPAAKAPRKKASAATAAPAPKTKIPAGGLVSSDKSSNRVSVMTKRGSPSTATEPEVAGPGVVRSGTKKAPSALSQVLNPPKKAASRSGASSAPAATPTAKPTSSVTFSAPKRRGAPISASYEYDDEDNYIEEGYVYSGESLYEAAAQVKVGPTKTAKGSASGMNTRQTTRKKGGRGLEQDDLQKAPRKGAGRPTVEDEDTARRSPIHQISGIADRNVNVPDNYMDKDGKKHTVTQKRAREIMHHYRHGLKNGEERSALMRAVDADPHHKLRASYVNKEEVEQPRMSAYSADSRSFALEHSIRNIISEGRNLRKEAMLSKYGLLEKAESLTKGKRLISTHTADGGMTFKVYKDPDYDFQVHHYKDGKHMGEGPVSYHDDKEDATDTAKYLVRQHNKKNEEVEHLGERVNIARIVSRHAGPGGHSAEVHYSPEEDHYEVHHKLNGRVDRSKTTTHDDKSSAQRSATQAMNSIKEDYELTEAKKKKKAGHDVLDSAEAHRSDYDYHMDAHHEAMEDGDFYGANHHADEAERAAERYHEASRGKHIIDPNYTGHHPYIRDR